MKNIILAMVLAFSAQAFGNVKVGLVNIAKVIDTIKEGKSVNTTLKKSFDSKQAKLKKEEEKIMKMQKELEKQSAILTTSAKEKRAVEMRTQFQKVQQMKMKFQKEIQKQEAELKKPILEKLKPVIDSVSQETKVSMTFELTTSPVVYAQEKIDLTDKVIKAYDKKYSK